MSVYIKGMEMPTNCVRCPLHNIEYDFCQAKRLSTPIGKGHLKRADYCPLIPVHDHGRLIDADALSRMYDPYEICGAAVLEIIADTPTIIPADEEFSVQKQFLQNWHEEEKE